MGLTNRIRAVLKGRGASEPDAARTEKAQRRAAAKAHAKANKAQGRSNMGKL